MSSPITFKPLERSDLPLLLKWLETPHVKTWWDQDVVWTPALIAAKYLNYCEGFKRLALKDGTVIEKPMYAYIVCVDEVSIGYIQYYNKHDFPPEQGYATDDLPESCAAFDMYIGEPAYIGQGLGSEILTLFTETIIPSSFDAIFVDPDTANHAAVRAYEKAGFCIYNQNDDITWMIKRRYSRLI